MKYLAITWALALSAIAAAPADYFAISVVDDATGRGVPLVELRTVDQARYYTDSNGLVAFHEPGLMNQKVHFTVESDGYEFPADGFGFRGKALVTTPGQTAELRIQRQNIAERLYRVTGAGIYRDSVLLGRETPLEHPLLNAQVTGSDSVNSIVFRDRIYWFWGDTNRLAYPLGNFHVPGATSQLPGELPEQGGLDPARGVNLAYFKNEEGFAKPTCQMPGDGPTWIDGLCTVREADGSERMFAKYMKVRKFLEVYERGLVEFNPEKQAFEKVATYELNAPAMPHGHAFQQHEYLYFGNPYPLVRVPAEAKALADLSQFEAYSCLAPGSTAAKPIVERDKTGRVVYGWKRNAPPPTLTDEAAWIRSGKLKPGEGLLALRDVESGKAVNAHAGTVTFNPHRKRYVMITCETGGTSFLGELWYAEADTPVGPWVYARKVVTHKKYSFYNPRQHPMFDGEGGRRIYFEGTYTTFMTGIEKPTPLYDYNQIMYGLDLDDPRLVLPAPVYEKRGPRQSLSMAERGGAIPFFAADRQSEGLVAVGVKDGGTQLAVLLTDPPEDAKTKAIFYALPADVKMPRPGTTPLFAWRNAAGNVSYHIEGVNGPNGYQRDDAPLCRVWKNPLTFELKP